MQDKIQLNSDKNNIPMWRNITDKISYITPTMQPLSANVCVIEGKDYLWGVTAAGSGSRETLCRAKRVGESGEI